MKRGNKIILLATIIFLPCIPSLTSQARVMAIVDKCLERRSQFESLKYTLELKSKAFAMEDTLVQLANVELVRSNNDSLFGGTCIVDMDSIWYGYDGQHLFKASPEESTLVLVDADKHPEFYIKGSWLNDFIDYGFLKLSQGLKNYLQEPDSKATFSDTMIGQWPCLGIFFQLPDQEGITNQTFFMAIDTIEYLFRNKMYSAYFQGNQQYTHWDYRQVQYGHNTTVEKLQEANLAKFNSVAPYESDTAKLQTASSFDFSLLAGKVLFKDDDFTVTDVHKKFIVLDFWYASCYPCIKSIPAINKIYMDYKDRGVAVYGINPGDDAIKNKARLEKFLLNNPMGYETIMVDPEIGNKVCTEGYPTFIILDQHYAVLYRESGFNENLYQKVSSFLDEMLKK